MRSNHCHQKTCSASAAETVLSLLKTLKSLNYYMLFIIHTCAGVFGVRVVPYVLSLQQVLAALVAIGMWRHLWVDTGVISAG